MEAPALDRASLDVSGADHEVEALLRGGEQSGHPLGRVGEVAVHGQEMGVAAGQGLFETSDVGSAQAQPAGAAKERDPRIGSRPVGDSVTGPVRRAVVHDQDVQLRESGEQAVDHQLDVLCFVVGRKADDSRRHDFRVTLVLWRAGCQTGCSGRGLPSPDRRFSATRASDRSWRVASRKRTL